MDILAQRFLAYDLFLIAVGPLVLVLFTLLLLTRTRWGTLVRAPPRRTARWWCAWA